MSDLTFTDEDGDIFWAAKSVEYGLVELHMNEHHLFSFHIQDAGSLVKLIEEAAA